MDLKSEIMRRKDLRQAAELAADSFLDYCYFTNYFKDASERADVLKSMLFHEYKTNFGKSVFLSAKFEGKIAAVAQLNSPDYVKPSDLVYFLNGWLNVYKCCDKSRLDSWLAMDSEASKPCHLYQKAGQGIWYLSSITVAPEYQGCGVGSFLLKEIESFVSERGGAELCFFTNSESNLNFYANRGYAVFDKRSFENDGLVMGSWSLKKEI